MRYQSGDLESYDNTPGLAARRIVQVLTIKSERPLETRMFIMSFLGPTNEL
jgi:hypothetical protein